MVLIVVAWIVLALCGLCAAAILIDIFVAGHRQHMPIMDVVWPINALYLGPLAVWFYARHGRPAGHQHDQHQAAERPAWVGTAISVLHCGAGCTLGDVIAETVIFLTGATIGGRSLWAEYAGDFAAALVLGIVFQYFAIAPMRGLSFGKGMLAAAKADVLALAAFEVGLFGWMALMTFVFPGPPMQPDSPAYWFLMQIGMLAGFLTSYPVNIWLIRRGIKEPM